MLRTTEHGVLNHDEPEILAVETSENTLAISGLTLAEIETLRDPAFAWHEDEETGDIHYI